MNLRTNSLAVSIGGIIRLVVNLAAIPILVRLLGIDSYGVWTTINAQIGLLMLAEMGVSTALLYRMAGYLAQKDESAFYKCTGTALLLITIFGAVFSLVYFLFTPLIARTFHTFSADPALLTSLKLSALIILPKIWALCFSSLEAAHQRYDLQAIIETSTTVLLMSGIIVLAWQNAGFPALLVWLLVSSLLGVLAHLLISGSILKVNFAKLLVSRDEAHGLMSFGLQHWVSSLGSSLFGQMDRILVNAFLGPAVSGVYSAATSITIKINELSAIPIKVITPAISSEKAKGNSGLIQQIYIKATKLNGAVVLLVALPLIFWADYVARIVVDGETAVTFAAILPLLACIYGIYSLGAAGFFLMLGLGKPIVNAICGVIGGLGLCAAMAILAPRSGIRGAIWANAAYIIVIIINFYGAQLLKIKMSEYALTFLRSVFVLTLWAVLVKLLPTNGMNLWLRIAIFFGAGLISLIFAFGLKESNDLLRQARAKLLHNQ
jgi:O-antigen/teichoic acid export membrane protein